MTSADSATRRVRRCERGAEIKNRYGTKIWPIAIDIDR